MADKKITELTEATTIADNAPLPFAEDPTGTPITKKIQAKNLIRKAATFVIASSTSVGGADYYCDGTDDDVQIQAAIDALPSGGGRILLREGTYTITTTILINRDNVILEGVGFGTVITQPNSTNINLITIGDGTNTHSYNIIRNLKVNGNGANQTNGYGIYIRAHIQDTQIQECWVTNTYKSNIEDEATSRTTVADCIVDTVNASGWYNILSNSDGALITRNYCTGTTGTTSESIETNGKSVVSYNYIDSPAGLGIVGLETTVILGNYLTGVSVGVAIKAGNSGCAVIGNILSYVGGAATNSHAIYITSDKCLVEGNFISSFTSSVANKAAIADFGGSSRIMNNSVNISGTTSVIGIDSEASNATIVGNNINISNSGTHVGIRVWGRRSSAFGNYIGGNYGSANSQIGISVSSLDSIINSNIIEAVGVLQYGIKTDATSDNCSDCQIVNNQLVLCNYGVYSDIPLTRVSIRGNQFRGNSNSVNGIFVVATSASSYLKIIENTISSAYNDAIILGAVSNSLINGNIIKDCGQTTTNTYAGIYVKTNNSIASTYNTISNNQINSTTANKLKYCIREDSSSDGPNIAIGNIALNAVTAQISTQHVSTVSANNITA